MEFKGLSFFFIENSYYFKEPLEKKVEPCLDPRDSWVLATLSRIKPRIPLYTCANI